MRIVFPWNDRLGRFAPLKALTLALLLMPGLWIAWRFADGSIGAKPIEAALHETGLWSLRMLVVVLAITPLRLITGYGKLLQLRRMIGVTALFYVLIHILLYVIQMKFNLALVLWEVILRIYLTIGFLAAAAMLAMGLTSTDSAIRRLGAQKWTRLHSLIYPLTFLAILHAAMQAKIDVSEEVILLGLYLVLLGVRVMRAYANIRAPALLLLVLLAVPASAGLEALWYGLATGAPWNRVFMANFDPDLAFRPAHWVGFLAIALPVLAVLPRRSSGATPARAKPAAS